MKDSTFADPAGLDDETSYKGGPRMSAYDIAIATRNAMAVPEIAKWAALAQVRVRRPDRPARARSRTTTSSCPAAPAPTSGPPASRPASPSRAGHTHHRDRDPRRSVADRGDPRHLRHLRLGRAAASSRAFAMPNAAGTGDAPARGRGEPVRPSASPISRRSSTAVRGARPRRPTTSALGADDRAPPSTAPPSTVATSTVAPATTVDAAVERRLGGSTIASQQAADDGGGGSAAWSACATVIVVLVVLLVIGVRPPPPGGPPPARPPHRPAAPPRRQDAQRRAHGRRRPLPRAGTTESGAAGRSRTSTSPSRRRP